MAASGFAPMSEEKPKPKPDKIVADDDTVDLARVAAVCDMLKAEVECLNAEVATMEQDLDDAAHDARKERDRLLDLLATQIAQAVLVGQQQVKEAMTSTPIQDAKTLDPILGYAPPHERGQMPIMPPVTPIEWPLKSPREENDGAFTGDSIMPPVTPIEWPLKSPREENDGAFTGDREVLEMHRRLAGSGKRSRLVDCMALLTRGAIVLTGGAIVAAFVAWVVASMPGAGLPRDQDLVGNSISTKMASAAPLLTTTSPRPEQPEAPASVAEKSASERERLDTTRPAPPMLVEVPAIKQAPAEIARQQPESAQPTAPDLITRQLDRDEVTSLVKRGETFIMSGDLASARLVLQRAAEAGDVHAALALAGTFDPNLLGNGLGADAAMARLWYVRAARLGSAEAAQRLQQLATQVNSVP
jgi:hypothetical protein